MTLRGKLILPLVVFGVLISAYMLQLWAPQYVDRELKVHSAVEQQQLATLAVALTEPLLKDDLSAIYAMLDDTLRAKGEWLGIRVTDGSGRQLYPLKDWSGLSGSPDIQTYVRAIHYLNRTLGELTLVTDSTAYRAGVRRQVYMLVTVLILALVTLLAVIGGVSEVFLLRPLARLASASRRLAEDDYAASLPTPGRDELGALIADFAGMRDAVQRSQSELRDEIVRREQAEIEHRRARQRFEKLVNSVEGIVWEAEAKTFRFVFVSRQAERLLGYPVQLWLEDARFWCSHIHPDDRSDVLVTTGLAVAEIREFEMEYRMLASDGRSVWLRSVAAVKAENGEASKIYGVMMDVTARKEAEAVNLRLGRILDHSFDEIYVFDAETLRFMQVNQGGLRNLGYSLADMKQRTPLDVLPEHSHEAFKKSLLLLRDGEQEQLLFNAEYRRKNGGDYPVEIRLQFFPREFPPVFMAIVQDVSERRRAEAERQAREAASEAARLKSAFLAMMSHEIRTPLNGVIGLLSVMRDWTLPSGQEELVKAANDSAQCLLRLLNDVLDHSRLEDGRMTLEKVDFDPRALIASVADLHRTRAESKGLRVDVEMPSDLPSLCHGDPTRLQQVLGNLVDNAVKFTERGAISLRVMWADDNTGRRRTATDCWLRFEVQDSGIGIAPEVQSRIFEPFSQADESTTRRFGGTGLGLSIVRELVHRMGGKITVSSRPGDGACFGFAVNLSGAMADSRPPVTGPA